MISKPTNELRIVRKREPLATVEVDLGSISQDYRGYDQLAGQALASLAARSQSTRATIYVYQSGSTNFGDRSDSAFFGVAGASRILEELHGVFSTVRGLRVRYSDFILASDAVCQYHLEGGKLWRPLDDGIWYADDTADKVASAPGSMEQEGERDGLPIPDVDSPGAGFFRVGRSNAASTNRCDMDTSVEEMIIRAARGKAMPRRGDWDKVFRLLEQHWVDLNTLVCPRSGNSLLTLAATEPAPEACERLLRLGADPVFGEKASKRSVLTIMVRERTRAWSSKHRRIVELLAPWSVNHQDGDGRTALMFASVGAGLFGSKRGNPGIIDQLMRLGADPSILDRSGRTALMHAIHSNDASRASTNHEVVELLKLYSADFAAKQWFAQQHTVEFSETGEIHILNLIASGRPRAIREDARVGTITKRLEDRFGLPEGSVALIDGKGKIMRGNETIGNLRKRHK